MFATAQLTTPSRNERESAHVCATHPARHVRLNIGIPPPPKSKQPKVHVRLSPQLWSAHMPQSAGQFTQSSRPSAMSVSQRMFPQTEHTPQSAAQLAQFSVMRQRPFPHSGHVPQSPGQVKQFSPVAALQLPSPHVAQGPQSGAHVAHVSPDVGVQKPSPQRSHTPQSPGQLEQLSVASHIVSPQRRQRPQSCEHVEQSSVSA